MSKKPLDAGLKRTFKIIGAALGLGVVAITAVSFMGDGDDTQQEATRSNVGRVPSGIRVDDPQLSESTRARLERVERAEAQQAREAGHSYIPQIMITGGEPITIDVPVVETPPPSAAPPPRRASNDFSAQRDRIEQSAPAIPPGLERQLAAIITGMAPATVQDVQIMTVAASPATTANTTNVGVGASDDQNATPAADPRMIINADEIIAAQLLTPIDTYRSTFVLAEVAGGKLNGAQLRGQVIPMNFSGDVEDVGIRFTSMNWNGKHFAINAIALSEQDSTDALNGKVDRRIFHRQVMPILMAGLSGMSTYFTALGTPATSVATGVSAGDSAIVVDQDKATREEARQQGIGDAIDKAVQQAQTAVDKERSRPNQVTLPPYTPIGVIFNAPVMANS